MGLVGRRRRWRGRTWLEAVAGSGLDRRPVVGASRASACRRRRGSPRLRPTAEAKRGRRGVCGAVGRERRSAA
ncbi:hypothetical protein NDU88_011124 [Pleurodeles waltl]|uniref:Uncharacterized protein n=1 Tax=Pleurodeles waltl TaxID=8319 RepID=A0AAV7S077_PLEWA|nr:hypothetical protein NDU88_011124 [Pleurodeles waltl]